jgi:hypothetical protein
MAEPRGVDPMVHKFGDIANEQMKNLGYDTAVKAWSAVWMWKSIVGDSLASVSRADRVRGQVLYVSVKNSSWAHHLSLMKRQFIDTINEALGDSVLTDIKFTVSRYSQEPSYKKGLSRWNGKDCGDTGISDIDLSDDVIDRIRETASVIPDGRLRTLFEKTQLADKKRKERVARRGGGTCKICGVPLEDSNMCPVCANSSAP